MSKSVFAKVAALGSDQNEDFFDYDPFFDKHFRSEPFITDDFYGDQSKESFEKPRSTAWTKKEIDEFNGFISSDKEIEKEVLGKSMVKYRQPRLPEPDEKIIDPLAKLPRIVKYYPGAGVTAILDLIDFEDAEDEDLLTKKKLHLRDNNYPVYFDMMIQPLYNSVSLRKAREAKAEHEKQLKVKPLPPVDPYIVSQLKLQSLSDDTPKNRGHGQRKQTTKYHLGAAPKFKKGFTPTSWRIQSPAHLCRVEKPSASGYSVKNFRRWVFGECCYHQSQISKKTMFVSGNFATQSLYYGFKGSQAVLTQLLDASTVFVENYRDEGERKYESVYTYHFVDQVELFNVYVKRTIPFFGRPVDRSMIRDLEPAFAKQKPLFKAALLYLNYDDWVGGAKINVRKLLLECLRHFPPYQVATPDNTNCSVEALEEAMCEFPPMFVGNQTYAQAVTRLLHSET